MKILFAAPENAWGGFLGLLRAEIPQYVCEATGGFTVDSLKGVDVLIPTMCSVTREMLSESDKLRLIQQCGAGLEGVDIGAAREKKYGLPMCRRIFPEMPIRWPNLEFIS